MSKTNVGLLAGVLLTMALAGCMIDGPEDDEDGQSPSPSPTTNTDPIPMGVLMPLTGDAATLGEPARKGAVLAVEQINAAGGIDGRMIELLVGDTQFPNTQQALAEYQRLKGEGVRFIVGALASDSSAAVKDEANKDMVILVSPSSTRPSLTGPDHGYFFRVIPNDDVQGPQAAQIIVEDLGFTEVTVMFQSTGYATGLKEVFVPAFEELGGTVVGEPIQWEQDRSTHDAKAQEAVNAGTDFIWIAGQAPEIGNLIKAIRNQGFAGTIMTSEAIEASGTFEEGGMSVNGTLFTKASPDITTEAYTSFESAYMERWGEAPGPFDSYTYDAVFVGAAAIGAVGNDGPAMKGWLEANTIPGRVTAPSISFNSDGDVSTGGYTLWEIVSTEQDQRFRPYSG